MINQKLRISPFQDIDGVVHSAYGETGSLLNKTDCGLPCITVSLFDDEPLGMLCAEGSLITCMLCISSALSCGKCSRVGEPLHSCPYDADVHNDPTPRCTCCESCARECGNDV